MSEENCKQCVEYKKKIQELRSLALKQLTTSTKKKMTVIEICIEIRKITF